MPPTTDVPSAISASIHELGNNDPHGSCHRPEPESTEVYDEVASPQQAGHEKDIQANSNFSPLKKRVIAKLMEMFQKLKRKFGKCSAERNAKLRDRHDWDTICSIPDETFQKILLYWLDTSPGEPKLERTRVFRRTEGSFHHVVMLGYCNPKTGTVEDYVIRVPAHGVPGHWQKEDEYMMSREVELMKLIYHKTNVPVPEVKTWDSQVDNFLVPFPYILMQKLPGTPAYNIWFDDSYGDETTFLNADCPLEETQKKRINFLRSLARNMTELQKLDWDKVGMPSVSSNAIRTGNYETRTQPGPSYHWIGSRNIHQATERGPFSSTQQYIKAALNEHWDYDVEHDKPESFDAERYLHIGARKILDLIFSTSAFNPAEETETFVARHDDLDLQNILTDKEGNITGIIDWDGTIAAPRCIGTAALPSFLYRDWLPSDSNGFDFVHDFPHMSFKTEYYRRIYSAAMVEANNPDAKFTAKSGMYQAAFAALYGNGDVYDFVDKLLRKVPELQVDALHFMVALGKGSWPAAEELLKEHIPKIMEPELPQLDALPEINPTQAPS